MSDAESSAPFTIELSRPVLDGPGLEALGEQWRALEAAADAAPFQSWAWIGCDAAGRFPDPVLVAAADAAGPLGLALWNRRLSRLRGIALFLHESGDPRRDAVFTEHNDPLLARRAPPELLPAMLQAAAGLPGHPRLILSGVSGAARRAAIGPGRLEIPGPDRIAPYVDLGRLPPGQPYAESLSRNTRQQLRRSDRAYVARGPLRIERAATAAEALAYFDALMDLHGATWRSRGKPGAFATPAVQRFHRALIGDAAPDRVQLLRIAAGPTVIGYLYNLVQDGWACAYQSGFDYPGAPPHGKPGLTCHRLAIEAHRSQGGTTYDFLGGPDRYKRSLSNAERVLHWLSVAPPRHPAALLHRLRRLLGGSS